MIRVPSFSRLACALGYHSYEHCGDFVLAQDSGTLWSVEAHRCTHCARITVSREIKIEDMGEQPGPRQVEP